MMETYFAIKVYGFYICMGLTCVFGIALGVMMIMDSIKQERQMDKKMADRIIAVDFDGTLCENAWPGIGPARAGVIDYVLGQQMTGAKLILWTNRRGEKLEEAVRWCAARGLAFDAVNENLPEIVEAFGGDTRKVFANEYLDDRAVLPEMVEKKRRRVSGRALRNRGR